MKDLVIIGAGGLAREAAFVVEEVNRQAPKWNILGFLDGDERTHGSIVGRYPVLAGDDILSQAGRGLHAVLGIGSPQAASRIVAGIGSGSDVVFPTIVHPSVVFDRERVTFGRGNVVCAGTVLTTDIQLGDFNYLNLSCTVGHDCIVGDFNVVNPGVNISGGVRIGDRTLVGTGAAILQNLQIGDDAVVGAGAVVVKDVEAATTVVGVPARPRGSGGNNPS